MRTIDAAVRAASQPAAALQELEVKGKVEFSAASAFLEHSARPLLDGVVALLATRPHLSVRIEVRWWWLLVFRQWCKY